jgi:hypothetical protein
MLQIGWKRKIKKNITRNFKKPKPRQPRVGPTNPETT